MFEVGKMYLLEHKHSAFGGGKWSAGCRALSGEYVQLGYDWHHIEKYMDSRRIIACLGSFVENTQNQLILKDK